MKILFVMNEFYPTSGGAGGVVVDEMRALCTQGHEVILFTGKEGILIEETYDWEMVHVTVVPVQNVMWMMKSYVGLRNPYIEKKFKQFLLEHKPDVVHIHNLYFQFPFSLLKIARKMCSKVFFTAHDVMSISPRKLVHFIAVDKDVVDQKEYYFSLYEEWRQNGKAFNPFRRFFVRHYLRSATKIFAVSNELKLALEANKIRNVTVLYNPVDTKVFVANDLAGRELRNKLKIVENKVVLVAGRLSVTKGGVAAVHILREIIKSVPSVVMLALSSQDNTDTMMKEAIKYDCAHALRVVNSVPRSDIMNYYQASDVVILPSLCLETFGMVAVEALSCAKPVVVTCFGGSREMVEMGKNGYIDNPLRTEEFANDVVKIITSSEAEIMGRYGRNLVVERFDTSSHMSRLLAHYIS